MKLALGTAQFGLDYGINNKKGKIPRKEVFEILNYANEKGIDTLDTSYYYGDSEKIIGEFIKENKSKFKIVSKISANESSNDLESIKNSFNESLNRLNLDKIDKCLIHNFESFLENPETWVILKQFKSQGKVKKIGFSMYSLKEIEYILQNNIEVDIVQVPFSIFDQRFSKIFPLLKEKGVEIYVRSVFLQGLVFKDPDQLEETFIKIKEKLLDLKSISKETGVPISSLCINFATLNEYVDKVIVGVDSIENLQENIKSLKDKDKVKDVYLQLLNLKEDDENIILPINWDKIRGEQNEDYSDNTSTC